MKKLLAGILGTLTILWGGMAHATPPLYGVNYANDMRPSNYKASKVDADFKELKASGVNNIRLATVCYDNCGGGYITMTKAIALQAKKQGMNVMWGIDTSAQPIDMGIWTKFLNAADGYVKWANDNNIDFINYGNEEDNRVDNKTITKEYLHDSYLAKIAQLKTAYPNQKIIYAASQDNIGRWQNTGQLDAIGFNLYGGSDAEFREGIALTKATPKAVVTEWNLDNGYRGLSQKKYAAQLLIRRNWLNDAGLKSYVFALRTTPQDDRWALWVGNTRREAWKAIIK